MSDSILGRPNQFLDGEALESWANTFYFEVYDEWECSDLVELVDFWEWLEKEYPDLMDEFVEYYSRELS